MLQQHKYPTLQNYSTEYAPQMVPTPSAAARSLHSEAEPYLDQRKPSQVGTPNGSEILWLHRHGVSLRTLTYPWIVGADPVRFDGDGFDFDPHGDRALIFRCEDQGETTDLAAWSARKNRLASWRGSAFCLGDTENIFNPATWLDGEGLRIHHSPLEWLQADREGIVILKPQLCWAYLRHVPRVICADIEHGENVRAWTKPPKISTAFFVETEISEQDVAA